MAYLETSLITAKSLWHFDFSAAPGALGRIGGGTGSERDVDGRERTNEF